MCCAKHSRTVGRLFCVVQWWRREGGACTEQQSAELVEHSHGVGRLFFVCSGGGGREVRARNSRVRSSWSTHMVWAGCSLCAVVAAGGRCVHGTAECGARGALTWCGPVVLCVQWWRREGRAYTEQQSAELVQHAKRMARAVSISTLQRGL